jgi:hypothetical protein
LSPRGSATGDRSVGGVPLRMLGFVVLVLAVVALLVLLASNALS